MKDESWTDAKHDIHFQELHQEFGSVMYKQQTDSTSRPFLDLEIEKL